MRVLINTVPFYGKGEGVRTYTVGVLRALAASKADMEWHVPLRVDDFERLGLERDRRFHRLAFASLARPAPLPGLRFLWRNALDQIALPLSGVRYSVVHFLDSYGPLALPGGAALALTVHDVIPLLGGTYHSPTVRAYLAGLMRFTIPQAAAILAVSQTTARHLAALKLVPAERVTVTPLGIDERFRQAAPQEQARVARVYHVAAPYFLFVGTIEPRKNVARLVRAFALARRQYQLAQQLVLVGKPGWGYDEVLAAVKEANAGDSIRLLGYVPAEDIPPLMSGADALVYPSLEEGFGLPVLEGMACGVPVITSSRSAVAEVAGDAGILVDPLSEEAIATALGDICQEKAEKAVLARRRAASLERASQYSWERVATTTIAIYQQLAARRSVKT